jgi:hypothetical protein
MAFGAAAEAAKLGSPDWLKYFNAFDRCFFSLRVSTALELRLKQAPAEPREPATDREARIDRPDPPDPEEQERPERLERPERYDERDRDRETERASFPLLLRTLEGVVADAEAMPGPEPSELPTLRDLIAHAKAQPPAAPRTTPTLRARLSGSVAAAAPPAKPHLASNVGQILAARHATGPPRR